MSLETLPKLEYFPHDSRTGLKFDVAYMDYEFVDRYQRDLKLLHDLGGDDDIRSLFTLEKIAPALKELMFSGLNTRTMPIYCVPIQFGFNEILVNRKGRLHKSLKDKEDGDWSHGDFNLIKLLKDKETKVVVWHWYLPSLLQFLLSVENTDVKTVLKGLSTSTDGTATGGKSTDGKARNRYDAALETHIKMVCGLLEKHPEWRSRITVCSTMNEIRHELTKGNAGVVLGQGSSVLAGPRPKDFEHIRSIVPAGQGVLVWINCATSVDQTSIKAAKVLINQWLDETTQMNMCKPSADYFGLPANRAALGRVLKERRYAQVKTVETFIKCTGGDKESAAESNFSDNMVTHRVLPRHLWGRWVHLWEKFVAAAN
jgi:hypothetical protein